MSSLVHPLSFPKGVKFSCELCQKPAHKICERCRVTYYCDDEHQQSDWFGIHEKICSSLRIIRSPIKFLPSEEERKAFATKVYQQKMQLIDFTRSISQRYLFEGNYQQAIPGATASLKFAIELKGSKHVELVPSYLILGEANQGLGNINQAQEYLSQAEWTVLNNRDCPLAILSKLYRNIAMLKIAKGDFDEALRNLAYDIYYASEEFGLEHVNVSGGYFLMANIFFKLDKMDIADSLYRRVTQMWFNYICQVVAEKTKISELDSILGKKEDLRETNDGLELSTEAEARKVLYALYGLRKNESMIDRKELIKIMVCLSMIHFLAKENDKSREFASLLIDDSECEEKIKSDLKQMIDFMNIRS